IFPSSTTGTPLRPKSAIRLATVGTVSSGETVATSVCMISRTVGCRSEVQVSSAIVGPFTRRRAIWRGDAGHRRYGSTPCGPWFVSRKPESFVGQRRQRQRDRDGKIRADQAEGAVALLAPPRRARPDMQGERRRVERLQPLRREGADHSGEDI